jgi:hypothetical protein
LGAADTFLQGDMIGVQIQDHHIAIASGTEKIDSILIRLQKDFKVLSERRA